MLFKDEESEIYFREKLEGLEKAIEELRETDLKIAKTIGDYSCTMTFISGLFLSLVSQIPQRLEHIKQLSKFFEERNRKAMDKIGAA